MSRTDKTDPYHVKVMDPQLSVERHDHRKGYCDYQPIQYKWDWRIMPSCGRDFRSAHNGVFARPSKQVKYYRDKRNSKERAKLRALLRNAIKLNGDVEIQNFQHRHSALWDAW